MRSLLFVGLLWASAAAAVPRPFDDYLARVRVVQKQAEGAYRASGVMTESTMKRITAVIDEGTALVRKVALEPGLNEDERGRLYEELLRGSRADTHGSLARVFWSTITHHGADDVDRSIESEGAFRVFRQTFLEVFMDLKSLVTVRRDGEGQLIWTARDRYNRERVARALTVRFADLLATLDQTETRGPESLDYAFDAVHLVVDTAVELRARRVVAERWAATLYAGMVVANLFGPMILPLVHFNWVGLATGGAWGSAPISGATYLIGYLSATVAKLFAGTGKTYAMLRELERVAVDPGEDPSAQVRSRVYRREIFAAPTVLGQHRRRMVDRGYRPQNPAAMSCQERLESCLL